MANKPINLLPQEVVQSKELTEAVYKLRVISMGVGFLGLVVVILATGYMVFRGQTAKKLSEEADILKSQVLSLEQSEQRLVLLRDRLTRLSEIQGRFPQNERFIEQKTLIDEASGTASLRAVDITPSSTSLGLIASTSADLSSFIEIIPQEMLSRMSFQNISFSEFTGYQVTIDTN